MAFTSRIDDFDEARLVQRKEEDSIRPGNDEDEENHIDKHQETASESKDFTQKGTISIRRFFESYNGKQASKQASEMILSDFQGRPWIFFHQNPSLGD